MMRVGLVLEGGAMRGMYTAGVLDVFLEHGIRADCIVGVSAGALFGVNFLSGQKGRVIRYNKRFNSDKNYMGLRPLLREGNIVSTKYAYEDVPRRLDPFDDAAYKKSGVPFYAVVTNLETGLPEYIKIDSVFAQMDALRASGSIRKREELKDRRHQQYLRRKESGWQRQYEDRVKSEKRKKMEAMKEQIRAEDIAAGVFIPVSGMPEILPQIGVPR